LAIACALLASRSVPRRLECRRAYCNLQAELRSDPQGRTSPVLQVIKRSFNSSSVVPARLALYRRSTGRALTLKLHGYRSIASRPVGRFFSPILMIANGTVARMRQPCLFKA
jgi:hypothetical protein